MKYELDVKECIDNGIKTIQGYYCYNKERLEALLTTIKKNGYEPVETIDEFLNCVSLESEKMFFNPTFIIMDILRTPVCKTRLIENIYNYKGIVTHLISFFKSFKMEEEYRKIVTILIENRDKHYRSFEAFMCYDFKDGVNEYYKHVNEYPDAKFFECIEIDYDLRRGYFATYGLLKACMNHIIENPVNLETERKFWNDNINCMIKHLTKTEYAKFVTKRYLILIPYLEFMSKEVQIVVVKRLGTRKQGKIFKDGYTRMIAYYIIGRVLNGETKVCSLLEDLNSCKRLVDWKELLRILYIAYEETDSYECEKDIFKFACDWIEDRLYDEQLDFLSVLDFIEEGEVE